MSHQVGFVRHEPGDVLRGRDEWILDSPVSRGTRRESSFVWRAHSQQAQPEVVAIKFAPTDAVGQWLAQREFDRLAAMPPSDHVVRIRDTDRRPGSPAAWYAIPWANGRTLADYYNASTERPLRQVLSFALHIVAGLRDAEVAHRDLRPENLLVYGVGSTHDNPQLRISNWARSIDHGAPQTLDLAPPSDEFAAPQVFDPVLLADVRDDLFSVGAIIWWAATGRHHSASHPRLDLLQPDAQPSTWKLVATLLSARREERVPDGSGRRAYLEWTGTRLREEIEQLKRIESQTRRLAMVGPGVRVSQRQRIELPPPDTRRAADRQRGVPASPQAPRATSADAASALDSAPIRHPRRAPVAQLGRGDPSPVRRTSQAPQPVAPEVASSELGRTHGDQRHAGDTPARGRADAVRVAIGALLAVHVVEGAVILHPSGPLDTVLAVIGTLVVAIGIAAVDTLIVDRCRSRPTARGHRRAVPTTALVTLRVVVAVAAAFLTSQALMVRIHDDDIAALRAADARSSLTTRLATIHEEHQRSTNDLARQQNAVVSEVRKIRATITARNKAARVVAEATAAEGCGATCQQLKELDRQIATLEQRRSRRRAAFISDRARVLNEIKAVDARNVPAFRGDGETRLMYRYVAQEPARAAPFVAILLMLLAAEAAIVVALRMRGGPSRAASA